MGYPDSDGLSFNTLRQANIQRTSRTAAYADCEQWGTAQWMQALMGELGELANIFKKIDRGDIELKDYITDVAKEIADIQTYLDLLAIHVDVDLGSATADKFNEVSERMGSPVYIGEDYDWHLREEDD